MSVELRPYQRAAIDAVHSYWDAGGGNPLIDLATGTGKSVVLGTLVREVCEPNPGVGALVLTHVKELVQQDVQACLRVWPQCPIGINSAGLGRRDRRARVLFASVQSVHREDALSLGDRHLIVIDEAHLVPRDGDGMYRKLIERLRSGVPDLRVVGLTATPYRLDSGRLDEGQGRIFDDVVYAYGIGDGVRDGYLSPLTSRDGIGDGQIDARKVARRGGEFVPGALETAAMQGDLVERACADIVERGADRRGWIVFCSGVEHAERVATTLRAMGVSASCVTGDTPSGERDAAIRSFKARQIRCLTSVGVLTTGFDAPHVDLIAMLRPTLSTGLYVQMLGRGTRLADGKSNCLVLDYSGNVRRHGPVDAVDVGAGKSGAGEKARADGERVMAKACPSCGALHSLRATECLDCGFVWPVEPKHEAKAEAKAAVMVREAEEVWHHVERIEVQAYRAREEGKPQTLMVRYWCGLKSHAEWICLDHPGFAGEKARKWWRLLTGQTSADGVGVDIAAAEIDEGMSTIDVVAIRIRRDGKWWRIADRLRSDGMAVDESLKVRRVEAREAA